MRKMEGGGWSAQAVNPVGQGEESKAEERANWSSYYLIKSQPWESKVLHLNTAVERDGEICYLVREMAQMAAGRGKDRQKRAVFCASGRQKDMEEL